LETEEEEEEKFSFLGHLFFNAFFRRFPMDPSPFNLCFSDLW